MNSLARKALTVLALFSVSTLVGCGDIANSMLGDQISKVGETIMPAKVLTYPEREISGTFPPAKGNEYPGMNLVDQDGNPFDIQDFRGQVVFVELAAIPCGGCQAFAGANLVGGYLTSKVQNNLKSIHHYAKRYTDLKLGPDVVFVQLLIYNNELTVPTQEEVTGWATHFGMKTGDRQFVLGAPPSILTDETRDTIPGFHLIDHKGNLVSNSCGHHPEDDLYEDLLPKLREMTKQKKRMKNQFFGSR